MRLDPVESSLHALGPGLTRDFLVHHRLCPMALAPDGSLAVAVAPDAILDGLQDIEASYDLPVTPEGATEDEVLRLIERLTTRADRTVELERADAGDEDTRTDVRDLANQPPVIR